MKNLIYFLVLILISCKEEPVSKPDKLIDKETMTNILYDVAVLQAIQGYSPAKFNNSNVDVENFIYNKYSIDSLIYYQNQKYYASNPKEYEKMYREVLEKINIEEMEVDSLLKMSKIKIDDKVVK